VAERWPVVDVLLGKAAPPEQEPQTAGAYDEERGKAGGEAGVPEPDGRVEQLERPIQSKSAGQEERQTRAGDQRQRPWPAVQAGEPSSRATHRSPPSMVHSRVGIPEALASPRSTSGLCETRMAALRPPASPHPVEQHLHQAEVRRGIGGAERLVEQEQAGPPRCLEAHHLGREQDALPLALGERADAARHQIRPSAPPTSAAPFPAAARRRLCRAPRGPAFRLEMPAPHPA